MKNITLTVLQIHRLLNAIKETNPTLTDCETYMKNACQTD